MLVIENNSNDPFFNHALEEYILTHTQEEVFILWINRPSILIGRNQNTYSEINRAYVQEHHIDVVRRLSGGGTVFCDLGNINFTFITNKSGEDTGFIRFAQPVINALRALDIPAEFSGRNDILIDGKKISGNAQYHYKDRLLHHGTLLYSGNITSLQAALITKPLKYKDKSVKSVASRVTNIKAYMKDTMEVLDFKHYLQTYVMQESKIQNIYQLSDVELLEVKKIQQERFETELWNYGKTPDFTYENAVKFASGLVEYHVNIQKGKIQDVRITGDFFGELPMGELETKLTQCPYQRAAIESALDTIDFTRYIHGVEKQQFIDGLLDLVSQYQVPVDSELVTTKSVASEFDKSMSANKKTSKEHLKKPSWIRTPIQKGPNTGKVKELISELNLNTVCLEANCPNKMECYSRKTATFMILGRNCTRNCTFCNVTKETPQEVDPDEPRRVALAVETLGLKHAVITSVTRDDLVDQGSGQFAKVVQAIRRLTPNVTIELLIPDFQGHEDALESVLVTMPDVLNHNIETVPSLYQKIRPMADYNQSLRVIQYVKSHYPKIKTKSGMMLGLGETPQEVEQTMKDLYAHGCDILTLGQYLQPSKDHVELIRYITPEEFAQYKTTALNIGFKSVASAPLVRSSYHADALTEF